VPTPEATGLMRQAVAPLEAVALHPAGRLWHEAGVKVKRRAYAHEQWGRQAGAHPVHPLLLPGLSSPDPDDSRARSVDRPDPAPALLPARRANGRRGAAAYSHSREARAQPRFQQLARVGRASAVEVDRDTGPGGASAELRHQVRAVETGGSRMPEGVKGP